MGTMIVLRLGNLEVDWGKNSFFTDHGQLFQSSDVHSIPPDHADGVPLEVFSKRFDQVRDRLELLGYSRHLVEQEYRTILELHGDEETVAFEEVESALFRVDVEKLDDHYGEGFDPGEFVSVEVADRLFHQTQQYEKGFKGAAISLALENFSSNSRLWLLSQNTRNLSRQLMWEFGELVSNGWAARSRFSGGAREESRFLIVTEGSSDSNIIRRGLELYRPHVKDFFYFVDMAEGYPFSGTGNLFNFTRGLRSIGLLNMVLFVLDNDSEGISTLRKIQKLSLPNNMRAMRLPDVESLRSFQTVGPSGTGMADINGTAAAIECFLDLQSVDEQAVVRWTSFKHEVGAYQGELENKEKYTRAFLELRARCSSYDSTKLEIVLDAIITECKQMAEQRQLKLLEDE